MYFYDQDRLLPYDEQISATEEISVYITKMVKTNNKNSIMISAVPYPSIGYWTDYSLEHIIKPSTNAACYAELDIEEPVEETTVEETPGE